MELLQCFAFCALALVAFPVFWFYWKIRKLRREAYKFGNPSIRIRAIPILGHIWFAVNRGVTNITNVVIDEIKRFVERSITNGVVWFGPYPVFSIAEPADVQLVLNSPKSLEGGIEHNFLKYAFGNGLITAPVSTWKISRRHLNPVYHPRNLEFQMPVLNECGRELALDMSRHVDQGLVDMSKPVFSATLKSICKLLFGQDMELDIHSQEFQALMNAIDGVTDLSGKRFFQPWLWPEFSFQFFYRKEIGRIMSEFKKFIDKPLKRDKIKRKSSILDGKTYPLKNKEGECQTALTDAHFDLRKMFPKFKEKDLQDEIITALMVGSESTTVTVLSCLLALGANPLIQERLYSEIVSVLGSSDADVTVRDLKAMPYLEQVIKETLRLFIIVPLVTRRIQEDLKISNCTLPAGATVIIQLLGLHFNPQYYPEPRKFNPDNFSPENVAQRENYTFLPFSGGPRSCIGKNYSFMSMKTLIVHIVRKFKLSTDFDIEKLKFRPGLVLTSLNGYPIRVQLR